MMMPGKKYSAGNQYRYGFNGKENASEMTSDGYDFGARIFDGRIGRWLSVDPLQQKYPGLSPYNFVANNPLIFIDPDGKRIIITGTQKDKDQFVAKLSKLTGFELELQNDGNIKILSDNQKPMSSHLRDAVFELLDEKGQKYENDVIFKLVNGKDGFKSNRFDRKETSSTVFFDNFESGALDLQDLNKAQDDATYASLLGHSIGERAQLTNYKEYIDKLDKERPYDEKTETLEIKDDGGVFDNAHLAGKILQTSVLGDFYEINGKQVRLSVPADIEYADMKKTGIFKFEFKGINITGTVNQRNPSDVQTVGTQVLDPAIKPK